MTGGQCGPSSHTLLAPLLFVLLMALPAVAQSPTVSVSGTVVDAGSRAPIAGAVVSADGRQNAADRAGSWHRLRCT